MNIDEILEYDRLARENARGYGRKRALYHSLAADTGAHFTGVTGPRGVGKTVILRQLALENSNSIYISLDTIDGSLFEIVKTLLDSMQIKLFLLDEVHFHPHFEAELKKIHDLLAVRVIFTSSTALAMYKSEYDLSRRVLMKTLFAFSLRELANFKYDRQFPDLSLRDIVENTVSPELLKAGEHFPHYVQGALMPFALEEPQPLSLLSNILKTIIYKDIPRIASLVTDELEKIEKVVRFIGLSSVDGINYSSISQNVHITKYKAEQYITLLERAFILQQVFPSGTNVLKEPKVVMALPYRLLFRNYEEARGGLREDFFIEAMRALGRKVSYLKSTRGEKTPDFLVTNDEDMVFEIGGRSKGRSQFKGIEVKKKIILSDGYDLSGIRRPLFLLGMINR